MNIKYGGSVDKLVLKKVFSHDGLVVALLFDVYEDMEVPSFPVTPVESDVCDMGKGKCNDAVYIKVLKGSQVLLSYEEVLLLLTSPVFNGMCATIKKGKRLYEEFGVGGFKAPSTPKCRLCIEENGSFYNISDVFKMNEIIENDKLKSPVLKEYACYLK